LVLDVTACSQKGKGQVPEPISGSPRAQPVNGNPLTQVQAGMTKGQVRNLLGPPNVHKSYWTWLSWLPGSVNDTQLTEWHYQGRGDVVFTESRFGGAPARVREVKVEPPRPGMPQH
jgi:hypothetical protein